MDKDCKAECGNGVLEQGETCDPKESCPSCKLPDKCVTVNMSGSVDTCNFQCSPTAISACKGGDGCCPNGCNSGNDSDCSTTCGNGKLEANETCETNAEPKCPATCDSGDACSKPLRTGNVSTCNVTCNYVKITQTVGGDGCCPPGASANTDSDCVAMCGNKKVEAGEECDDGNMQAGDGCTPDCKKESEVDSCLAKIHDDRRPECQRCNCEKCRPQILACYASKDESANKLCENVVVCALQKGCSGNDCYCGNQPITSCILPGLPNGPCRAEVEAASQSTLPGDVAVRAGDTTYPVGRANALAECGRTNCMTECGLK